MDPQSCFSGGFQDESLVAAHNPPFQSGTQNSNGNDVEKRFSDHFADDEYELHPHEDQFDFASNLQTHDSFSSLDNVGLDSHLEAVDESNAALLSKSWETFEHSGQKVGCTFVTEKV